MRSYGIKEGQYYRVRLSGKYIKGEILNFTPNQIAFKTDEGLYLFAPSDVITLEPIIRDEK